MKQKRWVHKKNFAICWDGLKSSVGVTEGKIEQSELLSNQQETTAVKTESAPQRLIRKAPQNEEKNLNIKESAKPAHKKNYSPDFIDWFVGFMEGDGSFGVNYGDDRVQFIITQKEAKVLHKIRTTLGYGKVYHHADGYYRYIVSDREGLGYLIKLFEGRLVFKKTQERYHKWVECYSKYYGIEPPIKVGGWERKIDLNTAWVSGLIDAEGCFSAAKRSGRTTYRARFTITQSREHEKMQE